MKKVIIVFAVVTLNFALSTLNCFAQPNGGFENWTPKFSYEEPDNWQTFNFLSLTSPPNPVSAFKVLGLDVHSGNYAIKLKTIFVNNNPSPPLITDTMSGSTFTGAISLSPFALQYGFPYTGRPAKLELWAKYFPVGSDIAAAGVALLKRDSLTHIQDTIAIGFISIPATALYTSFHSNLSYFSSALPDTAAILIRASRDSTIARVGSTLFADDVALTGWVGIDQHDFINDKVKLLPNPAIDNVTILSEIEDAENVKVVDAIGKLVGIYKILDHKININTSSFNAGNYFFEIRDKKNRLLTKSKFNVIK